MYGLGVIVNGLVIVGASFVALILKSKPATVKGTYVKNISISSTMGPGIKVDINSFDN